MNVNMPLPVSRAVTRLRAVSSHVLCAICLLGASLSAYGQSALLYAYEATGKRLISFSAEAPGTLLTDVVISGIGSTEAILGIDFRQATGELYAVAASSTSAYQLLKIDLQSGAATPVGSSVFNLNGQFFGVGFNSADDTLRVVSNSDINFRINPNTGILAGTDTTLAYMAGDTNAGINPSVAQLAYSRSLSSAATTAYGVDAATGSLVRVGGVDGTPSANTGQLTTVGSLGISIVGGPTANAGGFDIQPGSNAAYAALRTSAGSVLHTINLNTGVATALGAIASSGALIDGLAIAPPNQCLDLDGDGMVLALTDGLMLLRALLGITGTSVTNNALPSPAPQRATWTAIRTHMNKNCGMNFGP